MNLFLRYSFLVLLTILLVKANLGTTGTLRPASWEAFEKNLLGVIPKELSGTNYLTDYIFRLPEMQAIRDKGTISLWMEMADQGNFPLVATAGFLCAKLRQPERAFEAALSVLASSSLDISNASVRVYFVLPTIEYLSAAQPSINNLEVFTRFAQRPDLTKGEALFIWRSLSNHFTSEWIERMPTTNANPDLVALVADSVILDYRASQKQLSKNLSDLLNSFEHCNDVRATVFVSHIGADDPRLKDAMIRILKNESLEDDDLISPVYHHAKFIADHVRYQDLNLPPRRIAIIERVIKRQTK